MSVSNYIRKVGYKYVVKNDLSHETWLSVCSSGVERRRGEEDEDHLLHANIHRYEYCMQAADI